MWTNFVESMPLSLVVKCFHHLKHVNSFQKHTLHDTSNLGGMDICTTSLMAKEMVVLTHYEVIAIILNFLGLCNTIWMAQEKMIKPKAITAYPL